MLIKEAIAAIVGSASKIVFIMMALGVHVALFTNKISGEQYLILAGMAFTFYFSDKPVQNPDNVYAGK